MICRAIPFEGSEPYIFVSYCHKDKDRLYPIFEQMVLDGYRIWFDDGNHAGDDWLDNIEKHLEECKAVVAFISGDSSLSHNCKSEITYALTCKKKVIPILIDSADLPKGLRMQLSSLHYLKCSDFPSDKAMLVKVYEAEECKACKAPAGSLKLKDVPFQQSKKSAATQENKHIGIWDRLTQVTIPETRTSNTKSDSNSTCLKEKLSQDHDRKEKQNKRIVVKLTKSQTKDSHNSDLKSVKKEDSIRNVSSVPEYNHVSDSFAVRKSESNADSGNREETVIHSDDFDEEKTVYQPGSDDEKTVCDNYLDEDATVRLSRTSIALLLHPAVQRAYKINKPQTKLGRSLIKCDIVIEGNETISKYHADIIQYNNKCFLRDANSANGTYIKGEPLEAGKEQQLENPAIFQLNNESFILISGLLARKFIAKKTVSFLMNAEGTTIRLIDEETLPLNRNNKWSDGTLSDTKVHREAHALLEQDENGIHLIDESPEGGNGTHLNGNRLCYGESRLLSSGDHIRLGDTTLEFVSITI